VFESTHMHYHINTAQRILTVLARVFTTKDWQTLANSCSHHERVSGAETIFVRLRQSEVLEIKT
jgi:hypothetical protein